jgi:hypothetical protein
MKKMILFAVSLFAAGLLPAQEASTAADQVPIEEYVPKVIIEGKWGTGPGEFGRQGDFDYDLKPESLAVDSKGNVYILDYVNNRIQKYSSNGKHLNDIPIDGLRGPVQCWAVRRYDESEKRHIWSVGSTAEKPAGVPDRDLQAYIWPPEIQGINIVIDSKDNLYYYLKRNKDGKESGEVWQFRNDKLVKKTVVPVGGSIAAGQGLVREKSDDSVWIFNIKDKATGTFRSHEVKANKSYTLEQRDERYKGSKRGSTKSGQTPRIYMRVSGDGVKVIRE